MYVLDTNTLIYFFKGMGNVNQRLLSVLPKDIGIPSVVVYELEYGIAKSTSPNKRQKQLEELISLVNVLPFNEQEAKNSANIRAKLEKQGAPIGPYDTLIAGTALSVNGILVTNNTKEFERVKHLKLENWY
ncbi:type II toxin-antitoxin system tRNA(fMet)-specific endonuclease VapC [Alkalimarinus coralli]|uniref:type II toxin-antitoxin system tRNA(fMet)-specific endonuclease VapC n=1 Tax=Alkalimarinus coralli TaxID=2935863 RepID=UPI00202B5DA1|nr:type II toxin-antitoxin system VapC family toxin [Alkalimarinus coralli]